MGWEIWNCFVVGSLTCNCKSFGNINSLEVSFYYWLDFLDLPRSHHGDPIFVILQLHLLSRACFIAACMTIIVILKGGTLGTWKRSPQPSVNSAFSLIKTLTVRQRQRKKCRAEGRVLALMLLLYLLWSLLTGESVYKPKEWIEYSILRSGGGVGVMTVTVTVDLLARVMLAPRRRRGRTGGVVTALYDHAVHHCSLNSHLSLLSMNWGLILSGRHYRQPPGPGPHRHRQQQLRGAEIW